MVVGLLALAGALSMASLMPTDFGGTDGGTDAGKVDSGSGGCVNCYTWQVCDESVARCSDGTCATRASCCANVSSERGFCPDENCQMCYLEATCNDGTALCDTGECFRGTHCCPSPVLVRSYCGQGSGCTLTTCSECTGLNGCGWCSTTSICGNGFETGPASGDCADWDWRPSDCP
jgi:hypothetical protein